MSEATLQWSDKDRLRLLKMLGRLAHESLKIEPKSRLAEVSDSAYHDIRYEMIVRKEFFKRRAA